MTPAITFTVDSTSDVVDAVPGNGACATAGADCTLRAAIQEANALGIAVTQINVPIGTYLLTIAGDGEDASATGDLDIDSSIRIVGADAETTIVFQTTGDRVLQVHAGNLVEISGLAVAGGEPPAFGSGAGIYNAANLTLVDTNVALNTDEGGIYNLGDLTIRNSAVWGNDTRVGTAGGGIAHVGTGTLTLTNVTISNNTAGADGGGLFTNTGGDVALNNVTITGNEAPDGGGGIKNTNGTTMTLKNTIVAGNTDDAVEDNCVGPTALTSLGYNLDGDDSCDLTATGDITGVNPLLGPLTLNGGSTPSHAIHAESAAVDVGSPSTPGTGGDSCEADDQRGDARPKDGDLDTLARCDIGAFEAPEPPACSAAECLNLDMDADIRVTVPDLALDDDQCNASGTLHLAMDAVGDGFGDVGKEDRAFLIDFVSGWVTCPGPLFLGSSITSGGYIEEQTDTSPGLDFPATAVVTLCVKIDTITALGLLQNCQSGFAKTPIELTCKLINYDDITCMIDTSGGLPKLLNTSGVEKASINSSEEITLERVALGVGGVALPPNALEPGTTGDGGGVLAAVIAAIVAGAALLGGVTWYLRRRSLPDR